MDSDVNGESELELFLWWVKYTFFYWIYYYEEYCYYCHV